MHRTLLIFLSLFVALAAANFWLRAPTFDHRVWNVDEAIHSAVARELLAGGVLYRDTIDQRTPLTYYVVAGLYRLVGANNIYALHVFTSFLISLTAALLWLAGRAWRQANTGAFAAVLYSLLATGLLFKGDAFAFNTEWFVAFFTTLAAWLLGQAIAVDRLRWFVLAGSALALAFLSKQPALLDLAAPMVLGLFMAWRQKWSLRALLVRFTALATGWIGVVGVVALYFAAQGAMGSAIYYAWTYNIQVYGPEITTADRLSSALKLWNLFFTQAPVLLPWLIMAAGWTSYRIVQRTTTQEEENENPWFAFLLGWCATSISGAASGGRGFDHYFIQTMPAVCLLAGVALAMAIKYAWTPARNWAVRGLVGVGLATTIGLLGATALNQRKQTLPMDTCVRAAKFVQSLTKADERIFVWGYHPDFYLFAERQPVSRFVYASFLSGLVPWTNVAPERDTSYAVVPGAMESLLGELEAHRPVFFVDCSAGPNRYWDKYPLQKFPQLKAFVDRHYVLAEPEQFRGQGYDLYLLRDEFRRSSSAVSATTPASLAQPEWSGPSNASKEPILISFYGTSETGQLTGLELLIDDKSTAKVTFQPTTALKLRTAISFYALGPGTHTVRVRASAGDGSVKESLPRNVEVSTNTLPADQLTRFSLPLVTTTITPLFIQAPFGVDASIEHGITSYFAHAPSTLAFPLPPSARRLSGGFGFTPGAYAPENKSPTDGAEFRIELVDSSGNRRVLYQRLLQPFTVAADRGIQTFNIALPADLSTDQRLLFVIGTGPNDNASSDWTLWRDLSLESSR